MIEEILVLVRDIRRGQSETSASVLADQVAKHTEQLEAAIQMEAALARTELRREPPVFLSRSKEKNAAEHRERIRYKNTYPNFCRTCQGWGLLKDPHGRFKDCEECITKGRCPRCGENALDKMATCSKCGWHRDDNNRGLPGSNVI